MHARADVETEISTCCGARVSYDDHGGRPVTTTLNGRRTEMGVRQAHETVELSAQDWLTEYVGDDDLTLRHFAESLRLTLPMFKALRRVTERQEWLDGYALIQWQTSRRRQCFGDPLYVTDEAGLSALLSDIIAELDVEAFCTECGGGHDPVDCPYRGEMIA